MIQLVFMVAVVAVLLEVSVPLLLMWYVFAAPVRALRNRFAKPGVEVVPQPGEPAPAPQPGPGAGDAA